MYSPRARALLRSVRVRIPRPTSKWPISLLRGTDTMLAPGTTPRRAVREHTTPQRVLRGVLQPGDPAPPRALAQITSGWAGYHLGLAMLCLSQWIKRRWPTTAAAPWILAIPTTQKQVEAGPDTRKEPPLGHNNPAPAGTTPVTESSGAWASAHS